MSDKFYDDPDKPRLKLQSPDPAAENIARLAGLFPSVITEAVDSDGSLRKAVDFEALAALLGADGNNGNELYEFSWPGKKQARLEAVKQVRKTLRPCPQDSVNWDKTENLYIEGDNLDVLKLLQESYLGKIKIIYIDPPYNTGNDFIYNDDFSQSREAYQKETGALEADISGKKDRLLRNTVANGRFHSSWCSMIYPRLLLARNVLAPDGVILISCDDHEQENLKKICNEVFGEDNFVSQFVWKSKSGGANDVSAIATDTEYILVYSKNPENLKINPDKGASVTTSYNKVDENGNRYGLDRLDKQSLGYQPSLDFPIQGPDGKIYKVEHKNPENRVARWRWSRDTVKARYSELEFIYPYVYTRNYAKDGAIPRNLLIDERFGRTRTGKRDLAELFGNAAFFSFPKPVKLIHYLLSLFTESDSIIMDFFAGSSTTAQAVMRLNAEDGGSRKFIMVQLPEPCRPDSEAAKAGYANICEIGKERIRRAGEKIKKENPQAENCDTGFRVFRCASSSFKDVSRLPGQTEQASLIDLVSSIVPERSALDLFCECVLASGLPLSLPHEAKNLHGSTAHFYNGNELVCCFADNLDKQTIRAIAEYRPLRAVFRDSAFPSSDGRINLFQHFMEISPDTEIRVL